MDGNGNTDLRYANIYDYTGGGTLIANGAAATALGVGTFKLIDNRDSHPYLVRRLADGNCWMVENLDLELASFAGKTTAAQGALTVDNTDLRDSATVAKGYARVSTDDVRQTTSFELQQAYYEEFVQLHEKWELVRIYAEM